MQLRELAGGGTSSHRPLKFASLESWNGTVAELLDSMFDQQSPSTTSNGFGNNGVEANRERCPEYARCTLGCQAGADAIILSNHGGRQLDKAPVPFKLVPEVAKKSARMSRSSWTAASCTERRCCRYCKRSEVHNGWTCLLYGLMAGGRQGVDATFNILTQQITRTMKLLGVRKLSELSGNT